MHPTLQLEGQILLRIVAPLCLENNIEARKRSFPPENISCKVAVPVRGRRWLSRPRHQQHGNMPVNIEECQSLFENSSVQNSDSDRRTKVETKQNNELFRVFQQVNIKIPIEFLIHLSNTR